MKLQIAQSSPPTSKILIFVICLCTLAACAKSDKAKSRAVASDSPTWVDIEISSWQKERQLDYLKMVCDSELDPHSFNNIMDHFECERQLEGYSVPAGAVPDDSFDSTLDSIWKLKDCSDFRIMEMLQLYYGYAGHPALSPELWQKLKEALLTFKYWFTDPTPQRLVDGAQVIDNMWYWSENHTLIFNTNEYLAGMIFPDEIFAVTGFTGRQHAARALPKIYNWIEERARWGFTEWHSDVYYNLDMMPLMTLIELADDRLLAHRAAMLLDIVMLDVALHIHRGYFGVTHGRSYIKDKPTAILEDTFNATKLLFDDTEVDYRERGSWNGSAFARSKQYALPWIIRAIARNDEPMVDRERMNLPLDEAPPAAYDAQIPDPPYGLDYSEDNLSLWWSMSAFTSWPLLPLTIEVAERDNLWNGQFKDFSMVNDLIGGVGDIDTAMKLVFPIYQQLWRVFNYGLLKEVYTYTYRTADYMLSAAQNYRPGSCSNQTHIWQATFSETAAVFTTHPGFLPLPDSVTSPTDWDWNNDQPGPGYWTGNGSIPRAAVNENVGVFIYAPQFAAAPLGITSFDYREETHAYFPHAHFDEVIDEGEHWTFGRKDNAYVGLYSYRPTIWRIGQPEVYQNAGLPFDLVAEGGAQNVWIIELASASDYDSFEQFRNALTSARIAVSPVSDQEGDGFGDGFNVTYASPSQGEISFGWWEPFIINGAEVALNDYPRFDNPFLRTEFDDTRYEISDGTYGLNLDFDNQTRTATAPPEEYR